MVADPEPAAEIADAALGPDQTIARAGRNLPVAIVVGVALGALVTVPLFTDRRVFVGVVAAAVCLGCYEVTSVLREAAGRRVPIVPLVVGTGATYVGAYTRGTEALIVGVLLTALAVLAWRLLEGGPPVALAGDIAAALWVLCYVVLLAGFAVLLTGPTDGARRVTTFIAPVVCCDVGGYAAGVFVGRHLMAPSVSPKKSWEGFAGSVAACVLASGILLTALFHAAAWKGVVYGLAVVVTATVGDLGESMVKRDLGVKDMGRLLPGHGGIMDRLDSLLLTAPVAYLLLAAFVPRA